MNFIDFKVEIIKHEGCLHFLQHVLSACIILFLDLVLVYLQRDPYFILCV